MDFELQTDFLPLIVCLQVFQAKAAPRYISAWIAHLVIYGAYILLAIVLRIILMRRNVLKRRAATGSDDGVRAISLCATPSHSSQTSDPFDLFPQHAAGGQGRPQPRLRGPDRQGQPVLQIRLLDARSLSLVHLSSSSRYHCSCLSLRVHFLLAVCPRCNVSTLSWLYPLVVSSATSAFCADPVQLSHASFPQALLHCSRLIRSSICAVWGRSEGTP